MAESAQDKRLPATPRKIEKSRKEGQVARSQDLGHFAAIGLAVAMAAFYAPDIARGAGRLMTSALRFDAAALAQPATMAQRLGTDGLQMLLFLLPLLGAVMAAALAASVLSGGWNFSLQALKFDFNRANPLSGLQRLVSGQQLTNTFKSCFLAVLMGTVAGIYLWRSWPEQVGLLALPLPQALAQAGQQILGGLLLMAGLLGAFALVDVPLQRQLLMRRLRMSVQEVKQEHKEMEGNAEVKGRQKQRMREMSSKRMLAAVPLADLVVMNPTHYAVALKYDESKMAAPRVVAKGADLLALRIRDLAQESRVPVLQHPPLARALYAHTEVDQEIPARLFSAVAQVLAWVYQLRDALAGGRPLPGAAPQPEVPADLDTLKPLKPARPAAGDAE